MATTGAPGWEDAARAAPARRAGRSARALRAAALAAPLLLASTCLEWGGLLSAAWPGDTSRYADIAARTFAGGIPYHSFYDEYPPLALPAFLLPRALSERHYDLVFKLLMIACWLVALWLVARVLAELGASRGEMVLALATMALTPSLLGQVFLNRYDPYASLLGLAAVASLALGRTRAAAGWLAAGFEAKVYPLAAAPVVAIRIWRTRGERALAQAAGVFVAVGVAVSGFFVVAALGGIGYSYYSQVTRGLQLESLGASLLLVADKLGLYRATAGPAPPGEIDLLGGLPQGLADLSFAVSLLAIAAVAWAYWRGREERGRMLEAFAASVVAYTLFSKVLSPQYLTWLVPLVVLTRRASATLVLVAALLLTQAEVYYGKHGLPQVAGQSPDWSVWLLAARNALLLVLFALLLARLRRSPAASAAPSGSAPGGAWGAA